MAFCLALPERAGVVAIPAQVFYDDQDEGRHLVRWAFCKQTAVLEERRAAAPEGRPARLDYQTGGLPCWSWDGEASPGGQRLSSAAIPAATECKWR